MIKNGTQLTDDFTSKITTWNVSVPLCTVFLMVCTVFILKTVQEVPQPKYRIYGVFTPKIPLCTVVPFFSYLFNLYIENYIRAYYAVPKS